MRRALAPLGWLYAAWVRRRNERYDRPGAAERVRAPVVSVGNLSAGGTGKTPVVGWLAAGLIGRGARPAIVSRGYGGGAGKGPVVVSTGEGPMFAADVCGDEPWMLANAIRGAIVVVGSDRRAGARRAVELGADVILLDDGFQHRALARDLDVVLLDRTRRFDRDALLPVGMLREPATSLARADWILITRSRSAEGAESLLAAVRSAAPAAKVLHADHRPAGFFDAGGRPVDPPRRAVAFCGIGHPTRFRADLERLGLDVATFHALRDHQRIRRSRLQDYQREAAAAEAALVTTEKDLARIGPEDASMFGLVALRIEPGVQDGALLLDAVHALVKETSP